MKFPWSEMEGYPRLLTFCVTLLLIAGGLCGLQYVVADKGGYGVSMLLMIPGVIELAVMIGCALIILFVIFAWPISVLYEKLSNPPKDDVQSLFKDTDDNDQQNPK